LRKYYIQEGKELKGPFSLDELKGQDINFHSRLCEQGTNEWKTVQEIPDYDELRIHLRPDLDLPKSAKRKTSLIWMSLLFIVLAIVVVKFVVPNVSLPKWDRAPEVVQAPVDSLPKDTIVAIPTPAIEVPVDERATEFGYLISGIVPERMQNELAENPGWLKLERLIAEEWDLVTQNKILPISEWRTEIDAIKSDTGTLFYPFAGADFLYSNCFFPNCDTIIMVGLEPLGTIPASLEFNADFEAYVRKIKSSLYTSNRSGYFMTISMGKELHREDLNGVLPLILFYAIRQNYLVSKYEYVKMNEDGTSALAPLDEAEGIVITLTDRDRKIVKRIEYYKTDLSNDGFYAESKFHKYFTSIDNKMVFLKAASYLLHNTYFSNIREVILDDTRLLLQDDSGMPFSFFAPETWNTQLYGKYTRPIGLFSGRVQPELRAEFQSRGAGELPFQIGYNVAHNEPHLILATRK